MEYKFLAESLRPSANAVQRYFQQRWAIPLSAFKAEEKMDKNVNYAPTLSARTTDHHILCVDVGDVIYRPSLDEFVLDCKNKDLPVKLFIAKPASANDPYYNVNHSKALSRGVGILLVDDDGDIQLIQQPLSLSLTNVRPIVLMDYPTGYRPSLSTAYDQFRQGYPSDACLKIASELEDHSRKIAAKLAKKGAWVTPAGVDISKCPWKNLMELLIKNYPGIRSEYPRLTSDMLSRIVGIIHHRNQTGHKVKNTGQLIRRDRELRTRFENMCDILREFTAMAK